MNCEDRVPWGQGTEGTRPEHVCVLPCSLANIPLTPETQRDQERRIRREIANSNERRRMQSINAGFQSLKTLIPHTDGEKLSKVGWGPEGFLEEVVGSGGEKKASSGRRCLPGSLTCPSHPQAAILQQTAEYIFSLEQEKTRLLQQNTQLKRFIQVAPRGGRLLPQCPAPLLTPFPWCGRVPAQRWLGTPMWLRVDSSPPTCLLEAFALLPGPQFTHRSSAVGWALEGTG